jgi:hemoglobin
MPFMNSATLYDKIGGKSGVESLILDFYAHVAKDPTLRPFFRHTSFEKLYDMQQQFFAMALGGPVEYAGQLLGEAHRGRGISPVHISSFVDHLLTTLKQKGVGDDDAYTIIDRVNLYANEIMGVSY